MTIYMPSAKLWPPAHTEGRCWWWRGRTLDRTPPVNVGWGLRGVV
ncbi:MULTISPECIES: hypothetical protein [Micromonospora]|nr:MULTISPECIES: hypothetical protein [unclassified Micromonospora]